MTIKNFSNFKKIFTAIFVLSIYFMPPGIPRARAIACLPPSYVLGTGTDLCSPFIQVATEISAVADQVTSAAASASAAADTADFSWSSVGKNVLDYAAYAAAQNLLTQLTNNTIKWIQGGFHGSPSYAVDTKQMYTEIADNIAGDLVLSLRNIGVCEFSFGYTDNLKNAVLLDGKKRPYRYNQQAVCPFTKTKFNFTAQEFYNDFSRGGWAGMGAALKWGGNPYGVAVITTEEKAMREAKAVADKDKKLSWSNGFVDIYDPNSCNYPADIFYYEGDTNPNGVDYASGSVDTTLTQAGASAENAKILSDPSRAAALQKAYCKTTTPGVIMRDMLPKALQSDADRIGFADNMNKIIAAFLDQITQQTVRSVFGSGNSSASIGPIIGGGAPSGTSPVVRVSTDVTAKSTKQTDATVSGNLSFNADGTNAEVYFLYSSAPFTWDTTINTTSIPTIKVANETFLTTSRLPQQFHGTITGLLPNTTYWYNANANISGVATDPNNLHGVVDSFKTKP